MTDLNRSGSLFLLVVGIAGVIGILALAFSRLSREIHADVFRFLRREVCEQVLSSALEEAWSNMSFRGTTPDTPEYSWITESEKRKTRLAVEVPLTIAEAGFLSHDHPVLRPEGLEVSASIVDFRETDSKKRPYFPGEGVGTLALEAKCRVAGEVMRRTRTHDVKIVSLLSPCDRDRQNTYSQNGILDYTLFVRNATRDFIEVSIDGSPAVFKISFDSGAPPDRCGEVFIGTSDGAVEKKFRGNPGFLAECSLGAFPNLQELTSSRPRLRDFEGNEINNLNVASERGIQPFRHLNLASKRIAVSPDSPHIGAYGR